MNNADEQAAEEYYSLLGTYLRELNKAHKGIRRKEADFVELIDRYYKENF